MGTVDSNEITRDYIDSILLKSRLIDADLPDTKMELYGHTFSTPIMTAAFSHLDRVCENGMAVMAEGARMADAVYWCGMGSKEELSGIAATGAKVIKIIKPMADRDLIVKDMEHAANCGVIAMGIDIDHAFNRKGGYDEIEGIEMRPMTLSELKELVSLSPVPFVIKGVLSEADAVKCAEAGVKGIVVSHHHGIMNGAVPPLRILPSIVKEVKGQMNIFVDCSIASGLDAFKALALGADAVCAGRGLMDDLRDGGAKGVADALTNMTKELSSFMARTGYKSLAEIDDSCIVL